MTLQHISKVDLKRVLQATSNLFKDKTKWTQRASGRTATGEVVGALSPKATCFCLFGAFVYNCHQLKIVKPSGNHYGMVSDLSVFAGSITEKTKDKRSFVSINDDLGYDKVMEFLEEALAAVDGTEDALGGSQGALKAAAVLEPGQDTAGSARTQHALEMISPDINKKAD